MICKYCGKQYKHGSRIHNSDFFQCSDCAPLTQGTIDALIAVEDASGENCFVTKRDKQELQNQIDAINGQISVIEGQIQILEQGLVDLQADVSSAQSDIDDLKDSVQQLYDLIDSLNNDVISLTNRLQVIEDNYLTQDDLGCLNDILEADCNVFSQEFHTIYGTSNGLNEIIQLSIDGSSTLAITDEMCVFELYMGSDGTKHGFFNGLIVIHEGVVVANGIQTIWAESFWTITPAMTGGFLSLSVNNFLGEVVEWTGRLEKKYQN